MRYTIILTLLLLASCVQPITTSNYAECRDHAESGLDGFVLWEERICDTPEGMRFVDPEANASTSAITIAQRHAQGMEAYPANATLLTRNLTPMRCPGCFAIIFVYEGPSQKLPEVIDRTTIEVALNRWLVTDASASVGSAPGQLPLDDPKDECTRIGREWRDFPDSCVDSCALYQKTDLACAQVITEGCDCGGAACWNGTTCQPLGLLDEEEAFELAQQGCTNGTISREFIFNENTQTWWFVYTPNGPKAGCNPACVVDEASKSAEINWRCTGLIENASTPADPQAWRGSACEEDADCLLPAEYAMRSTCPFQAICKDFICTIGCPTYESDDTLASGSTKREQCTSQDDCQCEGYQASDRKDCVCHDGSCFALVGEMRGMVQEPKMPKIITTLTMSQAHSRATASESPCLEMGVVDEDGQERAGHSHWVFPIENDEDCPALCLVKNNFMEREVTVERPCQALQENVATRYCIDQGNTVSYRLVSGFLKAYCILADDRSCTVERYYADMCTPDAQGNKEPEEDTVYFYPN